MGKSGEMVCDYPAQMGKKKYTRWIREGVERQGKCSFFHRICTWDSVHGALSIQEMRFGPPYSQCHPQGGRQVGLPSPWRPHTELPNSNNSYSELMPVASCPHW